MKLPRTMLHSSGYFWIQYRTTFLQVDTEVPCSISTAAIGSRDSVQTKELRVFNDQFHVHLAALSHRRSHIKASQYHPKSSDTIRQCPPKRKKEDNPNIINIGVLYGVHSKKTPHAFHRDRVLPSRPSKARVSVLWNSSSWSGHHRFRRIIPHKGWSLLLLRQASLTGEELLKTQG